MEIIRSRTKSDLLHPAPCTEISDAVSAALQLARDDNRNFFLIFNDKLLPITSEGKAQQIINMYYKK